MNNPTLYLANSTQTVRDFQYVFKKYSGVLSMKDGCTILDIGCGPGHITHDHLLPKLPQTFKKLVAVDISNEMVNYAKRRYQNDSRLRFQQFDVVADYIPNEFKGSFDHVFSFYMLHFIVDQRKALRNIYAMLKPGGSITLTFMERYFAQIIYKALVNQERWRPYLAGHKIFQVPLHNDDNFKQLLTEVGFVSHICQSKRRIQVDHRQTFLNLQTSVHPFPVPKELEDEFILEYINVAKTNNLVHTDDDDEEYIHFPYTLLIVHATKPL